MLQACGLGSSQVMSPEVEGVEDEEEQEAPSLPPAPPDLVDFDLIDRIFGVSPYHPKQGPGLSYSSKL